MAKKHETLTLTVSHCLAITVVGLDIRKPKIQPIKFVISLT